MIKEQQIKLARMHLELKKKNFKEKQLKSLEWQTKMKEDIEIRKLLLSSEKRVYHGYNSDNVAYTFAEFLDFFMHAGKTAKVAKEIWESSKRAD